MSASHLPGSYDERLILVAAIEAHRDRKYEGAEVTDPRDAHLYAVAVWFRSNQQEIEVNAE